MIHRQLGHKPGYVPTAEELRNWAAAADEDGFDLQFTNPDSETVLIYVTYLPTVNREVMNMNIDAVKEVINIKAKGYGWQSWVKAAPSL